MHTHHHHFCLRSFTVQDPAKKGINIGVVLYQQAFYLAKANPEKALELLNREPYATGGLTIGWTSVGDIAKACFQLV